MARTYRKRIDWAWVQILFGPTPAWQLQRDKCPRHCLCHAGARKHRRLRARAERHAVHRWIGAGKVDLPTRRAAPYY